MKKDLTTRRIAGYDTERRMNGAILINAKCLKCGCYGDTLKYKFDPTKFCPQCERDIKKAERITKKNEEKIQHGN